MHMILDGKFVAREHSLYGGTLHLSSELSNQLSPR
jgi:hypothetical protein